MKLRTRIIGLIICSLFIITTTYAQDDLMEDANMLYGMQAFDEAIETYKKALKAKPGNVSAFTNIADAYRRTNRMKEAAEWYGKAINTGSAQTEVSFQYGLVLKAQGRYAEAKQWFDSYSNIDQSKGKHFLESCDFAIKQTQGTASFKSFKELINSSSADFGPTFYGKKIVYSSARKDIKNRALAGNANYANEPISQLLIANTSRKGALSKPKLLLDGIQARTDVGPLAFTSDRNTVLFTENNFQDGIRWISHNGLNLSLHSARVGSNGSWSEVASLPFNSGGYSVAFPSLSADGNTLYFSSDRPDGFGGFDIYVSYKRAGKWSEPENLGSGVNTQGDEITPFILGSVLYFSSNWHWGLGGYDIFSTKKVGSSWGSISHLGKDINSTRDDFGFIFNPKEKVGYFSSNRLGGKGDLDIYRVEPTKTAPKVIVDVQKPSKPSTPITNPGGNDVIGQGKDQVISLKVLSGDNKLPINNAVIDFADCKADKYTTNFNGIYEFKALAGLNCNVTVSKQGYEAKTINLRTNNQDFRTIEVTLEPLEAGFAGYVVDATNQLPIANVYIKAVDVSNNQQVNAISNTLGRYVLPIKNNKTYNVTLSKSGYKEGNISLNTMDGSNKNILGRELLQRSATYVDPNDNITVVDGPNVLPTERGVKEVWAVQIGVFRNPDINQLQKLNDFGNVFREPAGAFQKYKVGSFKTRAEANKIKKAIVAATGMYQDAILVKTIDKDVINTTLVEEDIDPSSISVPGGARPGKKTTTPVRPSTSQGAPGVVYKVQLGVYSKPQFFERKKYSDLGSIQTTTKVVNGKKLTVFLLGNFTTKASAEAAKAKIVQRGLPNAFIVSYRNGKLIK
ncbi:MAG: carboxypeptidase regulatory-like domain-containing protein [Saprospiraceae bacterium]